MAAKSLESAVRLVVATAPDEATARELAKGLIEERLAACVTLLPGARSFYRWKGETAEAAEVLLLAKTVAERYGALEEWLAGRHPYEVPEILSVPVESGLDAYLAWVAAETRGGS